MCGLEALNIAAAWNYPAAISKTPLYAYSIVLFFDCILYSILAGVLIDVNHKTMTPVISKKGIKSIINDKYDTNSRDYISQSIFQRILMVGYKSVQILGGLINHLISLVYRGFKNGQRGPTLHNYMNLSNNDRLSELDIEIGEYNEHKREEKKFTFNGRSDIEGEGEGKEGLGIKVEGKEGLGRRVEGEGEGGHYQAKMTIKGLTKEYMTGFLLYFA